MSKNHENHDQHEGQKMEVKRHDTGAPYWRRAHHDWRFWAALLLMLVAISVYVATDNLSLRPRGQTEPPSGAAGK
jgi:hypothetical protein